MNQIIAAGTFFLFFLVISAGSGISYADLIPADINDYSSLIGIGNKTAASDDKLDTLVNVDALLDMYYSPQNIETVFIEKLEEENGNYALSFSWNDLDFTLSGYEEEGTWTVTNRGLTDWTSPIWYSLKSSTWFALFDSGVSTVSASGGTATVEWQTIAMNENGPNRDLSHISFWTEETSSPVPEPATMLLFGSGLVGIAGIHLRMQKKKRSLQKGSL